MSKEVKPILLACLDSNIKWMGGGDSESKREEGISLEGIPLTDQTKSLLRAAKRTGDATVLSKEDALSKAILDEELRACDALKASCGVMASCKMEIIEQDVSGLPLLEYQVEQKLRRLAPDIQATIQKQAERFMEDAKPLIEKIKAGQKPVEPKVPSAPKL